MMQFARALPLILAFVCGLAGAATAQQESQYTSFMYNELYYNPASAGSRGAPSVMGIYRQQWAGFEGAPVSQIVSFNSPLVSDAIGFGFQLAHSRRALLDNVYASMAYNYKLKLSERHALRLGLNGSLQRWAVDFTDPSVRVLSEQDTSIDPANTFSTWEGNVGFGAYLELGDYFTGGVGVPNIYRSRIGVDDGKGDAGALATPHVYVTASGLIDLSEQIAFKPSTLLTVVQGAPVDFNVNLGLVYAQRIMGGLGYRAGGDGGGESASLLLFVQATEQLGLGGAYDFGLSELSRQTNGSIEVLARFDFGSERDDLVNPRFF